MEAIDDYANENIARSLAYSVLEYRQQHEFTALVPLCSKLLQQRMRFLGPPAGNDSSKEWNSVIQWQQDDCPQVIDTLWSQSEQEKLYQKPVYYKRLDAETLHCIVEFAVRDTMHYAVVLVLEADTVDAADLKYHNTRAFSHSEWQDIVHSWSRSLEHAEREFVRKLTHTSSAAPLASPPEQTKMSAPDDYWGGWDSSDDDQDQQEKKSKRGRSIIEKYSSNDEEQDSDDSDDEYYARWSKDPPGVLTPGPASSTSSIPAAAKEQQRQQGYHHHQQRTLEPYSVFRNLDPQQTEQQEIQEEYDQSYNPLYTVPSVPDLMGMHNSALAELTSMLHASLPNQNPSQIVPVNIDPLPKVLQRRIFSDSTGKEQNVPGAFPATEMLEKEKNQVVAAGTTTTSSWEKETGRALLTKGFRALISVGKLLGFQGSEILEMVQELVKSS